MKTTTKKPFNLRVGSTITGKWHKNAYFINHVLGAGAIGTVYLAKSHAGPVAIKISENNITVTSEVNVLKILSPAQGKTLGPRLIDVDDIEIDGKIIPFYVMEYIEGVDFFRFAQYYGPGWVVKLTVALLDNLHQLHKQGWIFGDLKPENIIVEARTLLVRFVDVGGTTRQGRAIKEFTEYFDRGFWGIGSRKAEPSYDLFAIAMMMINTIHGKKVIKKEGGIKQLQTIIGQNGETKKISKVLMKALQGQYKDANEMKIELETYVDKNLSLRRSRKAQEKKRKRRSSLLEVAAVLAIAIGTYYFYMFY
jgi:serine/threonine-protein kinase